MRIYVLFVNVYVTYWEIKKKNCEEVSTEYFETLYCFHSFMFCWHFFSLTTLSLLNVSYVTLYY